MKILAILFTILIAGCSVIGDQKDNSDTTCLPVEHDKYAYISIDEPESGQILASPIMLTGCSRTFESNVVYQLMSYDKVLLAMGFTNGGGVDGSEEYSTEIHFDITSPTLAYLRVYEANPADIEERRFMVPINKITLFLMPPEK